MSEDTAITWKCEYLARRIMHTAVIDHPTKYNGEMRIWTGFITSIYQERCSDGTVLMRIKGNFASDRTERAFLKEFCFEKITRFVSTNGSPHRNIPTDQLWAFLLDLADAANDAGGRSGVSTEVENPPATPPIAEVAPFPTTSRWSRLLNALKIGPRRP